MPYKAELKISIHYDCHCAYDLNKYEHLTIVCLFLCNRCIIPPVALLKRWPGFDFCR